ncbi:MAG: phosphate acyltransferase PlsX [Chloroflexota bacterium]
MSKALTRVALDAMGGDHAPGVVVEGAVAAARELGVEIVLVGPKPIVEQEMAKHDSSGLGLTLLHADEVVGMDEHAAAALRQKRRSSIALGVGLVREGQADAFVSAGNSGAVMAAALFGLGRIEGIERPAIGTVFPTSTGKCFIVDAGANTDCKPEYLVQFAAMGSAYMERVFGVARPRVGLLSNGEEESKGNSLVQGCHPLLKASSLNFVGNMEGKDIPLGAADVVVCDGFAGNIVIKLSEGLASALFDILRTELTAGLVSKLAALAMKPAFRRVKKRLDYAEYGGAPLLGVNGVAIIAHGRSNALAIKNAVRVAKQAADQKLVEAIRAGAADMSNSQ